MNALKHFLCSVGAPHSPRYPQEMGPALREFSEVIMIQDVRCVHRSLQKAVWERAELDMRALGIRETPL